MDTERNATVFLIMCCGLVLRWAVGLYPYSGKATPPMFGDYEAQRHWMEITVNLPVGDWYRNTTENDLMYWGLDYPPLTAYHSFILGKIANVINSTFVELQTSRGHESEDHKFFMRLTVLICDLLIFFPAVVLYFNNIYEFSEKHFVLKYTEGANDGIKSDVKRTKIFQLYSSPLAAILITLVYPGLILIDNGHFQYNSVSLGLTIAAVSVLVNNGYILTSIYFCLALNYKQMSLYHSLPFFVYLLKQCIPARKQYIKSFLQLTAISVTVLLTFLIIWSPFLTSYESLIQVFHRLFPLSRGVFEDIVANFWCSLNVLYKIKNLVSGMTLAKVCGVMTLLAVLPSLISLSLRTNIQKFILSLIICSLGFFLFSFQVHEKSILLVATPVLLYIPFDPFPCFWFLLLSTFSMFPLLLKDGLIIPFISLTLIFYILTNMFINFEDIYSKSYQQKIKKTTNVQSTNYFVWSQRLFYVSMLCCVILIVFSVFVPPPDRYPFLWPLLVSVFSFVHFILFYLYFNFKQILC